MARRLKRNQEPQEPLESVSRRGRFLQKSLSIDRCTVVAGGADVGCA